jgi:hypothetical protein
MRVDSWEWTACLPGSVVRTILYSYSVHQAVRVQQQYTVRTDVQLYLYAV